MNKRFILTSAGFFLLLLVIFLLGVWRWRAVKARPENQSVNSINRDSTIITSFYPLFFLASRVAGEQMHIVNLTKTGIEPHDYEPSSQEMEQILASQMLIVNGNHFEIWLDKLINNPSKSGKPEQILQIAPQVSSDSDPHFWLDPLLMAQASAIIGKQLQAIDPAHADQYLANSQSLIAMLTELDQEFTRGLGNCHKQEIITSHNAFAYLAKKYHFTNYAIQGVNLSDDPSPSRIAELIKLARDKQIKYIFSETLLSQKIAKTIADEVGALILVFDPLEGLTDAQIAKQDDYFSIQRQNLANLRLALDCQ